MRVLFLTLKTFSATGGIEKFNRSFAKALWQNALDEGWEVEVLSAYDRLADEAYLPNHVFTGFGGSKNKFSIQALKKVRTTDIVIVGHINLAAIAVAGQLLFPSKKWILIAHGREVWGVLPWLQRRAIVKFDSILSVSRFTSSILVKEQHVSLNNIVLFPNTLDPYFGQLKSSSSAKAIRARYGLQDGGPVIITVSRLAKTEKTKGYYEVLDALPAVLKQFPTTRYLLCGKADSEEKNHILLRISELNLQKVVILTGFVEDSELPDHYLCADLFAMPSRKEGFGIVFIEAAWWGLPIIAGNQDGSTDALLDGKLGSLVNPTDTAALETAIINLLSRPASSKEKAAKRALVEENFGFDKFRERQKNAITGLMV